MSEAGGEKSKSTKSNQARATLNDSTSLVILYSLSFGKSIAIRKFRTSSVRWQATYRDKDKFSILRPLLLQEIPELN